ncbi:MULTISPECIES: hypothetical protein [Streptomyces]|uniref:hypothetical protein n=1 Tax=Streptomyces TaxID=1883 RepID=UPI001908802A|nr:MULTISPECIES: hypothetical protein [unclassified Streptomyces]MCU4746418.1 hypothetical protein [Streptomyces sp. G-5]QQN76701.1 hypothetical protein IPZ77_04005 [Streptomyces sp. XC 2026]
MARSTRVTVRPEPEQAPAPAHRFLPAVPRAPVIFTVHELERLAGLRERELIEALVNRLPGAGMRMAGSRR